MILRQHYPDAEIDALDIDPEVVSVAKDYFGFREDSRMRAVVADGRRFIEQSREAYDIIFLDAFGSDSVPRHLTTQEFLLAVRRTVKPGGVVVGNVWSRSSNSLYDSMVRTYREVFDELYILKVVFAGNRILLALPRRRSLSREELARMAAEVGRAGKFRYDLGEIVSRGLEDAGEEDPNARALKDTDGG
jgi:spermidine synthase